MKKILIATCLTIGLAGVIYAGNQYNWGTSTGASWVTPDDTAVLPNQVLVIGSTTTYPTVLAKSTATFIGGPVLPSITLTQVNITTPTAVGQILYCSNCVSTPLIISTGTSQGAWVAVSSTSLTKPF